MFPEYRDLISRLKTEDARFQRIFDKHNQLDHEIQNMESGILPGSQLEIEAKKKEKLALKDELYVILKKAEAASV